MFLTCQQCETQYRLDADLLGGGRMVRCTSCTNIWFQAPEKLSMVEEIDLLKQIGLDADAPPPAPAPEPSMKNFRELLQQSSGTIPDVVKPTTQGFTIPVMEYRPMGMQAGQFGLFAFLLFTFSTLIFLFVLRVPMVNQFPVMASLYKVMGFEVRAPGEGLRLSEMIAEHRIDGEKKRLAIEAKLANISERDMEFPKLHISLKSAYGRVLQEWDYTPEKRQRLASGDALPVKMEFKDMHKDGNTVEMKVAEE